MLPNLEAASKIATVIIGSATQRNGAEARFPGEAISAVGESGSFGLTVSTKFVGQDLRPRAFAEVTRIVGRPKTGVVLARQELALELTVTSQGVYWHPVGVTDDDFRISNQIFPLLTVLRERSMVERDNSVRDRLAKIFNCA